MNANYSPMPPYGVSRTNDLGKTIAISVFVGATLCVMPYAGQTLYPVFSSNSSSPACIDYYNLDGKKGYDYLDCGSFLDLLRIENLKKLECMSGFEENWNGVGGVAFSATSIELFREIIEGLNKQPNIAPTGRNSLLLQYELDDHSVLAFEVRTDKVEMVRIPRGDYSAASCGVFTDDYVRQINNQVECFYGHQSN